MPGYWSIIVPVEKRNLITNPSLERGTAGWDVIASAALGTTSSQQAFGVWAGSVAPAANGTSGVLGPTFTASNGSAYAYSFYGSFPVGSAFIAGVGDSSGNGLQGSFVGTGGGTWHRYIGSFTESAGATRRLAVRKNNSAVTTAFYVDGHQVEAGSFTTYLDGDQDGCLWDGPPHRSASLRSGTSRAGGTVLELNPLGLSVQEHTGIGMPDVTNVLLNYGLLDGGAYQRTKVESRTFALTALLSGTTYPGLLAYRAAVIDLIKPDLTPTQQSSRFLFTGAGGTTTIDAFYDGGLGLDSRDGWTETFALRFVAPDPYWEATRDSGTSLPGWVTIGSANWIAYRDPYGRWGTLGVSGTTLQTVGGGGGTIGVAALVYSSGTLFMGGDWGTLGGTTAPNIGQYANGAFGTLTGNGTLGVGGGGVTAMSLNAAGSLLVSGVITVAGGTATQTAAQWNGQWGTLGVSGTTLQTVGGGGGTIGVAALVYSSGTLFMGGDWGTLGGTTAPNIGQYANGAFGTLTGNGTLGIGGGGVTAMSLNAAGSLLVSGVITVAGGTATQTAAQWNGQWGTLPGGTLSNVARVINTDIPGTALFGGAFTAAGGTVGARYLVVHNGQAWGTLTGTAAVTTQIAGLAVTGGAIVAGGGLTSVAGTAATGIVFYSGGSWGTFAGGGLGGGAISVTAMTRQQDFRVAVVGGFSTISGQVGTNAALADLNSLTPMNTGVGTPGDTFNFAVLSPTGRVWIGGPRYTTSQPTFGPIISPLPLYQWTGANWLPADANLPVNGAAAGYTLRAGTFDGNGGLYVGGDFAGIGTAAAVAQVVNVGAAAAHPRVTLRNPTSGTARVFQVLNTLTNTGAYFNLVMTPGEVITIVADPTQTSVTSTARGNLLNTVLPGSNLSRFRLEPGTNYLSVFADTPSLVADIQWRPRAWSADDVL